MFSYYGSKSKVIDAYPSPRHDKIIEPFAGSARYALKWFDRDVLLVDKYATVVKVWRYLQQASERNILGLPNLTYKQSIDDCDLSEAERLLMGFMVARGIAYPQKIVQQFSDIPLAKKRIARNLHKIRHWDIQQGDYRDIGDETATWFIDPPYQDGGHKYPMGNNSIDFNHLSRWCQSRRGQVIVCENTKADWLPFWPMRELSGAYSTTTEAIWSNLETGYEVTQLGLFALEVL